LSYWGNESDGKGKYGIRENEKENGAYRKGVNEI